MGYQIILTSELIWSWNENIATTVLWAGGYILFFTVFICYQNDKIESIACNTPKMKMQERAERHLPVCSVNDTRSHFLRTSLASQL